MGEKKHAFLGRVEVAVQGYDVVPLPEMCYRVSVKESADMAAYRIFFERRRGYGDHFLEKAYRVRYVCFCQVVHNCICVFKSVGSSLVSEDDGSGAVAQVAGMLDHDF